MGLTIFQRKFSDKTISPDEQFFVQERMTRRHFEQTEFAIKFSICFHVFGALIMPSVALPSLIIPLVSTHLIVCALCVLMLIKSPMQESLIKYLYPVLLLVIPIAYFISLKANILQGDSAGFFISGMGAFLVGIFSLFLDPGNKLVHTLWLVIICGLGYWGFYGHQLGSLLGLVNSVSAAACFAFTQSHKAQYIRAARLEYNLLIRAAPAKIVRQSASGNLSISEVFAPRLRYCVCMSSDWRGYQELSASLSVDALSKALGDYYEMCEAILSKAFPDGNYYTDWIADEFFVVIYQKSAGDKNDLVNQSLEFAHDMILGKRDFVARYGLPDAIDIGVSCGEALIGMMGPSGHQKATALGEVPGWARRIQGAGKLIRMQQGDRDRVIFGAVVLLDITKPFVVQEYVLEPGKKLRDLDHERLFFIDPETTNDAVTAA